MFTRNTLSAAVVGALAFCAAPSFADEKCYDFSRMTVGTSYQIGDEVDIGIGKVRIREFIKNGEVFAPVNDIDQHLEITQSKLAQGESPEVALRFVGMQILPKEPVQEVSMLVAQQLGLNASLPAYVEINGERHDFAGSFNLANNKVFGQAPAGRVRFKANLIQDAQGPNGPSYWHRGRIGARALQGGIETITFGAEIANVDQVCLLR